mmetsp:Transcript_27530/g.24404  ORF Transcript_27530/g.24404 Transcript_27530/m.24404 type:complete len:168 (-) Transcript_27530:276-779(-)
MNFIEKVDYKTLYLNSNDDNKRLKINLHANKGLIEEIIQENKKIKQLHKDEVLILNKIIADHQIQKNEEINDLNANIDKLRCNLETKEHELQIKENRWSEVDKVLVEYTRNDIGLRDKLTAIPHICDDLTTQRRITTVISENEELKNQVEEIQSQLTDYRSNMSEIE